MNIVITGASSGVGFETVLELCLSNSHSIVALARSKDKLEELAKAARNLNTQCSVFTADFDISHGDYVEELMPLIKSSLGTVDVLVNNAGTLVNKPFAETTQLDFVDMIQSNLLGHVKMIQHLLPLMGKGSHIVNIGSMGGFQGSAKFPGLAAYSASKSALHTLTECLAAELADKNIKVNCLALGSAQTEMLNKAFPGYKSPVTATEMGKFIADFAITGHKFFNGKVLPVSGATP